MKKILALLLAIIMVLTCAACAAKDPIDNPTTNEPSTSTPSTNEPNAGDGPVGEVDLNTGNIDGQLISFLENEYKYADKNYVFSPLSFKYAITLATYGASGQTQSELLAAMGYKDMDENTKWIQDFNKFVNDFAQSAQKDLEFEQKWNDQATEVKRKLMVGNSIWHNIDQKGTIKDSYMDYAKKNFNADAFNVKGSELANEINAWVDKMTNGLIPKLFNTPQDERNTILINTLYLKSPWRNEFSENFVIRDFHGKESTKETEFMQATARYSYYNDKDSTVVELPLEGGLTCAFVMGNSSNLSQKLEKANGQRMNLLVPKFEIETALENKELVAFLKGKGVNIAFDKQNADFSNLIDGTEIHIEDIVQKAKFIANDKGVEAAAVTAIMMDVNESIDVEKTIDVTFDKPFKFFVYTSEGREMLFCGNYCNVE